MDEYKHYYSIYIKDTGTCNLKWHHNDVISLELVSGYCEPTITKYLSIREYVELTLKAFSRDQTVLLEALR